MPQTKHPYSKCCGASLDVIDTERFSRPLCKLCQNSNTRAVRDERPFVAGDIVNFIFPNIPEIKAKVVACRKSESYGWSVSLEDGTMIGASLLKLRTPESDEIR